MNTFIALTLVLLGVVAGSSVASAQIALQVEKTSVSVKGDFTIETSSGFVGKPFILDGTKSQDDGTIRSFLWRQVSGPTARLSSASSIKPTFTPAAPGTYVFELVATDSTGLSSVVQKSEYIVQYKESELEFVKKSATSSSMGDPDFDLQKADKTDLTVTNEGRDRAAGVSGDPDFDLLRLTAKPAATIMVNAATVRGWDTEKKEEFLASVKAAAEIRSDQELEHFAQGVLMNDENISEIAIDEPGVQIAYRMPAKFLGLFSSSLTLKTTVDAEGRVKVSFPWLRLLYSTSVDASAAQEEMTAKIDAVRAELQAKIDAQASFKEQAAFQGTAEIIEAVTTINKAFHEMAKSIIQNIKA